MARTYEIAASDQVEYNHLVAQLKKERETRGWTAERAARQAKRGHDFVSQLERGRPDSSMFSSLQSWAMAFDMRVEPKFRDLDMIHIDDQMFRATFLMSRKFEATDYLSMWIPTALKVWREATGVAVSTVARRLGVSNDAVARWEKDATDPLIKRVFAQARATGTSLRLELWHRDDWIFG